MGEEGRGGAGPGREKRERVLRHIYLLAGLLFTGLGFIGIFLPLLPTTPFLLLALWCFARSSQRFHDWLYNHARFGRYLQDWKYHGVIPLKAKILSVTMMTASFVYLTTRDGVAPWVLALVAAVLLSVAAYILSRPSQRPKPAYLAEGARPTESNPPASAA